MPSSADVHIDQARDFLDDLVYGRTVELRSDPSQADTDMYGRLLRHVIIDARNAAVLALEASAGHEYAYEVPYASQQEHKAAEQGAVIAGAGLWSACS